MTAGAELLMQNLQVCRVHRVLHRLQPVAIESRMHMDLPAPIPPPQCVEGREQRRRIRSHVCPDEPEEALYGVGRMLDAFDNRVVALRRRFQNVPFAVVEPAVVGAGDPPHFHASVDH